MATPDDIRNVIAEFDQYLNFCDSVTAVSPSTESVDCTRVFEFEAEDEMSFIHILLTLALKNKLDIF